ncbi:MAG: hypothetical protein ACYTGB_20610, partial [Planctomycetota bacterium]
MSTPLRWILAAALAPGIVAGAWLLLEPHLPARPGRALPVVRELTGAEAAGVTPAPPVRVLAGRRARGGEPERTGRGLGAYLVRSGRPNRPLVPVEVEGQLPKPSPGRLPGETLEEQPTPSPAPEAAAAERRLSAGASRGGLPVRFAPQRRRIGPAKPRRADPS